MKKIKVIVGIDEEYTREKIINCFKYRTDYEVTIYDREIQNSSDYDIYWLEYEDLDFENLTNPLHKKVLFNSYCIRKGLIRKAQLAFYLQKYLTKKQNSTRLSKYIPETYIFQLDYLDYLDEALNDVFEVEMALVENSKNPNGESKKFILKSSMTNKGAEMLLFDSRESLENYFKARIALSEDESLDLREWVIQAYLDKPLLLETYQKRKFHLRVYVLSVGNLNVYVYRDILALFSYTPYCHKKRLDADHVDLSSHITNTCFQLNGLDANEVKKAENECVKRFWEMELNEAKKEAIFDQIKECVGELFACFSCEPTVFQPLANAFELYGLDFLVDENYQVLFLEANAFPDFKQTGDSLNDLINCLFYQSIAVTCDRYFNLTPICDSTMLSLVFNKDITNKA